MRLRADGYPGRVFVLYPIPESQAATAGRLDVDVSLGSLADFERVAAVSGLAVHIEIDTGMTRGGCRPEEFASLVGAVRRSSLRLVGVWTHLAAPEDPAATERQLEVFHQVTDRSPPT